MAPTLSITNPALSAKDFPYGRRGTAAAIIGKIKTAKTEKARAYYLAQLAEIIDYLNKGGKA